MYPPFRSLSPADGGAGLSECTSSSVLGNSGTASLTVSSYTLPSGFVAPGGTCASVPITIAAGGSCSITLSFSPVNAGAAGGPVAFAGPSLVPQILLVSGNGSTIVPTITFSVPDHRTGDAPFTVSASSNSAGAFTYSVVSGPATILGSTVTLNGAGGTVMLQVSQAANGNYTAGSQTASFQVASGSVWLGNSNSTLSEFSSAGAPVGSGAITGGGLGTLAKPQAMAFDHVGNVWVTNQSAGTVTEVLGAGTPSATLARALTNNTIGSQP